ncbi:MAG: ABC transporter ATP-binding protein/permease [Muribaculaceae bacterium]|nr:ABC transporter ATP-binding protein/permease [Muribaculaceae bacterium]
MTRGFRKRIAISALAGIIRVITGLVFVALSKRAVDIATGQADGDLTVYVAALACALVIELICSSAGNRNTELSEAAMKDTLQQRIFSRLLTAKWTGRETFHSGDMLSRLTEDCRIVSECLCRTVPAIIVAAFQLTGAFIFLWYFSPVLAIILFLLLPVFILGGKLFYRKVQLFTQQIRETESQLQERMQESLQHRILLLTCRQTARAIETIRDLHHSRYSLIRRRTNVTVYSRTAIVAGFETGYLVAFIWGIIGLSNGTVSFGLMTAYLQLAGQIQRPIAELARLIPGLIQSHTAFSRIADIENMPLEEDDTYKSERTENSVPTGIIFHNVTFAYPEKEQPVFSRFSHNFAPGSCTAIMGMTGTGKSTLLRLILALLKPQEGDINLFYIKDGEKRMMPVSVTSRNQIVYVPQGNSLLSGTIRQNLQIGKPDATDEEMYTALHRAAADFVHDLKYGLDTTCGEHGEGLSEGQAQRIAIARGLLCPGNILLLDEISASLDEATETLLMQRLTEKHSSHTVLLVTHRSSVLTYCDSVLHLG